MRAFVNLKGLAAVVAIALVLLVATRPGPDSYEIETCSPDGFLSAVSAWLYGNRFWQAQLGRVDRQKKFIEFFERIQAESKKIGQEESIKRIEVLSKGASEPEVRVIELREQAHQLEQEAMLERQHEYQQQQLQAFERCENIIRQKLWRAYP